jgi:branched-chain amino acid transport system ATP-binding protein
VTDTDAFLTVTDVNLDFGGVRALLDVNFEVASGELVGLIGPNGAGKTSMFNCLNGVYHPQTGSIRLDGHDLVGKRPARIAKMGVARTFQNLGLFTNLDVVDNLMLGRHHLMKTGLVRGALWWPWAKREEISNRLVCLDIAEFLDLDQFVGMPVGLLPYGVQKRVELARALAMEPTLMLLDEPVAGMNHEETAAMDGYIRQIQHERGMAMLLVEHDMSLVMGLADRVVVLNFGEVIASGTPAEVSEHPEVVAAYLGIS